MLHFNICECDYFLSCVYYFFTRDINWRSFYRLISYYMNKNIYCKSSAIKSLMEFWIQLKSESNSNMFPKRRLSTIANLQVVSRTDTSTDYYRITDAHNAHTIYLFSIFYAKSANSGVLHSLHWVTCCHIALWNMDIKVERFFTFFIIIQVIVWKSCEQHSKFVGECTGGASELSLIFLSPSWTCKEHLQGKQDGTCIFSGYGYVNFRV